MDTLSMVLIYIGGIFGIGAIIIRPYPKSDVTQISKWNFILPTIGCVCILVGFLIKVFVEYG